MRRRYGFIETRLLWAGGCTAGELGEAFGISRQAAQAVISAYEREYPENMSYNPRERRHTRTEMFSPRFVRRGVWEFLEYLRGQAAVEHYLEDDPWSDLPFTDGDRILRPKIPAKGVRLVIEALYRQETVQIHYQSKGRLSWRTISPHHLIFIDNRYHVRGYCFLTESFRDFVLSRVEDAMPGGKEWISAQEDRAWNRYEETVFEAPVGASADTLAALSAGLSVDEDGRLRLHCRQAIGFFLERRLRERGWRRS